MGNQCCSDSQRKEDTSSYMKTVQFEQSKNTTRAPLQQSNQATNTAAHEPRHDVAEKIEHMNSYPTIVSECYKKIQAALSPNDKSLVAGFPKLGPYKFKDGSTYEGQFKDGRRYGFGKLVTIKGKLQEGYWVNDEFDGKGVEIFTGGKTNALQLNSRGLLRWRVQKGEEIRKRRVEFP